MLSVHAHADSPIVLDCPGWHCPSHLSPYPCVCPCPSPSYCISPMPSSVHITPHCTSWHAPSPTMLPLCPTPHAHAHPSMHPSPCFVPSPIHLMVLIHATSPVTSSVHGPSHAVSHFPSLVRAQPSSILPHPHLVPPSVLHLNTRAQSPRLIDLAHIHKRHEYLAMSYSTGLNHGVYN